MEEAAAAAVGEPRVQRPAHWYRSRARFLNAGQSAAETFGQRVRLSALLYVCKSNDDGDARVLEVSTSTGETLRGAAHRGTRAVVMVVVATRSLSHDRLFHVIA